jgi:mRNA-degrading endonuclease toxin of MazEF toxin-antitoxin module
MRRSTTSEISTSARGLTTEVHVDHVAAGLDRASILTTDVGELDDDVLEQVCAAVSSALGC